MKKKLILLSSILCLMIAFNTNNAFSQIKIGIIGGANFNDLSGDNDSKGMLLGYHLGATVNLRISNSLSLEPQVLYSIKGANFDKGDIKLDYIEIPVWLRYQLEGGLNFNAGAYAGILTSAKIGDQTSKDDFTNTDFGIGFGVGYQMAIGFGIALNYSIGLSSIGEDYELLGQTYSYEAKTSCIKLSASYTFGGRRESK